MRHLSAARVPVGRAVAAALLGGALCAPWGIPPAVAGSDAPPPGAGQDDRRGGDAWQRVQPTQERTRELLSGEDVQPSPAERREELRTLNELSRELLPPGAPVPAPRLEPHRGETPRR